MKGLSDLSASERGVIVVLAIVSATVLTLPMFAVMTVEQWLEFVKPIVYVFIGGQTVTTVASIIKGNKPEDQTPVQAFQGAFQAASGQSPTPVAPSQPGRV